MGGAESRAGSGVGGARGLGAGDGCQSPRSFAMDVLECPKCAGRCRVISVLTDPVVVGKFLDAIGENGEVCRPAAARGPAEDEWGQVELDW